MRISDWISDVCSSDLLIFPSIVKAGLIFGGAYGEGVLEENGAVVDYYNTVTGSWGLQAGAQSYGYAVFLMNDKAVKYPQDKNGRGSWWTRVCKYVKICGVTVELNKKKKMQI